MPAMKYSGNATPSNVCVTLGRGDDEIQDDGIGEREHDEPPVADVPEQLVAQIGGVHRFGLQWLVVLAVAVGGEREERLLEPGAADLDVARPTGTSRAARAVRSRPRRRSGSRRRRGARRRARPAGRAASSRSAPGSVARIVRPPTLALISAGRAVGHDASVREQHDPVGERVGLLEVVRGEDDGLAARGDGAHRQPRSRAVPSTSSAAVGSSSNSRSGSATSAIANRTRWAWPPDSFLVRRPAKPEHPLSARASSTSSGRGYSDATIVTSSRTLR